MNEPEYITVDQFEEFRRAEQDWRVELGRRLDRSDQVTLAAAEDLRTRVADVGARVDRINGSVSDLVRWRWFVTGGFAVLTFVVGSGGVLATILYLMSK